MHMTFKTEKKKKKIQNVLGQPLVLGFNWFLPMSMGQFKLYDYFSGDEVFPQLFHRIIRTEMNNHGHELFIIFINTPPH